MRFLIRATIPTEGGNKMVQDPNFLRKLEEYTAKVKAEAAYFFEANGNRLPPLLLMFRVQTRYLFWVNLCLLKWVLMWSSTP
jgi:hypothetical protein